MTHEERLHVLTAGSIGCPQNEVVISSDQFTSWEAQCRGRSFVCSPSGKNQIACSPTLTPVGGMPAPVAEDPRTACPEAAEYDRRAAAATSPAREQLQKIAEHKHHDCEAGQGAAAGANAPAQSAPVAAPAQ